MNIALLGCGRMGREIAETAIGRGHTIAGRFTSHNPLTESALDALCAQSLDCCIDFSTSETVLHNIMHCMSRRIPLVVGTTGWHEHLPEARRLVARHGGALVHSSNFSPGAQIFLRIVSEAARLMNSAEHYDAAVHEIHHRFKLDAPSGTARTIAGILLDSLDRKARIRTGPAGASPIAPEELCVSSARLGAVFGTHTVLFSSTADEIELTHRAHHRAGFALGAVMASEWVRGRQGVFTAEDVFFG